MAQKKIAKPAWYKNTYFWIAGILFILCILGLPFLGGDGLIRDPGQKREGSLWLLYLVASAIMLINGLMSHSQTVQHYREVTGDAPSPTPASGAGASVPGGKIQGVNEE